MGPRTRQNMQIQRHSVISESSAGSLSPRESGLHSPGAAPRYSGPSSGEPTDSKSLSAIAEGEFATPPAPENPTAPSPILQPAEPLNIRAVPKVATLTPPPQVKFDSVPIKWKGLPLEAALWTFDSKELQSLVSRAIRSSSRESFIRILSVENLDHSLPAELDRLNALKAMTQSKYRFQTHRRTMLLQALNSIAGSYNKETNGGVELVGQLSQTTAECDQLLEDLLQIADQIGQITRLLDGHWASALAIALRKLNSSYGRRTSELLSARAKIATLEAELEDAWKAAEGLAREMDAEIVSDEEGDAVIEVAEVVSLHLRSPSVESYQKLQHVPSIDALSSTYERSRLTTPTTPLQAYLSSPEPDTAAPTDEKSVETAKPTELVVETTFSLTPPYPPLTLPQTSPLTTSQPSLPSQASSLSPPQSSPLTPAFVSPLTPPESSPLTSSAIDTDRSTAASDTAPDNASIHSTRSGRSARSVRSTRSARSTKSTKSNKTARSFRAAHIAEQPSAPNIKTGRKQSQPPVPTLPTTISPDRASTSSFLDFDLDVSDGELDSPVILERKRTSIDDIQVVARSPALTFHTQDDIQIMPTRSAAEAAVVSRRSQFSLDNQHPFATEEPVTQSIPSIWLLQETPKTPAERVESMMRAPNDTKMGSFQRLKSLTKRYSLPFPVPNIRSKSNRSAAGH
ncbi:hypothetical protein C8J57DRAFT_1560604 [Mycena rebaudengoi]|nr:hypothetical protein C8J57DRAFT_1560604 [Mycena rebaudengoi]